MRVVIGPSCAASKTCCAFLANCKLSSRLRLLRIIGPGQAGAHQGPCPSAVQGPICKEQNRPSPTSTSDTATKCHDHVIVIVIKDQYGSVFAALITEAQHCKSLASRPARLTRRSAASHGPECSYRRLPRLLLRSSRSSDGTLT